MRIKINVQIFLFIIIFILTNQIQIYGLFMLFGFIHEIVHMLTGIALKLKPKTLEIMPFGLSIVFETYESKKTTEIKRILIALAGPLINIVIAIIWYAMQKSLTIIYINILIACFNLLPIYPLDGGRALKSILKLKYDFYKTEKTVNILSNTFMICFTAFASILILIVHNISILFVTAYLWVIIINENRKYELRKKVASFYCKR